MTQQIPPVFVSHGSPMLALEAGRAADMLSALGQQLPRPAAILVASAHWDTLRPAVSASANPETIHDFYGFPRELYQLGYHPPGAVDLAGRVVELLATQGIACAVDPLRGLDHGAWVPLRFMYPEARIPVVQLSIQSRRGPSAAYALGKALAPLAEQGVLLLGSGSITHNFQELEWNAPPGEGPPWVEAFVGWIAEKLRCGDDESVVDYRARAPYAQRSQPTEDHMVPLHFALGAARARGRRSKGGVSLGTMSMDAFVFDGVAP